MKRLASGSSHLAMLLRAIIKTGLRPLEPCRNVDSFSSAKLFIRGAQLADDLLGVMAFAFYWPSHGQVFQGGELT